MKTIFKNGGLKSATIKRAPLMNGYIIIVKNNKKESNVMTTQREKSNVPRSFRTIDVAVSSVKKIGFKKVTVELD